MLVSLGAKLNVRFGSSREPLLFAASTVAAIELLLNLGADINVRDIDGRSVMHRQHTAEMLRALAAFGADINARDDRGQTQLHLVSQSRSDADLVPVYAELGADVVACDDVGGTPIFYAWSRSVVAQLVARGADADTTPRYQPGATGEPIGDAGLVRHIEVLKNKCTLTCLNLRSLSCVMRRPSSIDASRRT